MRRRCGANMSRRPVIQTDLELQPTAGMFASPQVNACMHARLRMESGTLLEPQSALRFSNERCTDMDSAWIAAL